jgi:hypothetical protein
LSTLNQIDENTSKNVPFILKVVFSPIRFKVLKTTEFVTFREVAILLVLR